MALNAVFSMSCPSCGAPVPIYSATSALAVCEYCHSTLIRSGDTAVETGEKSALIEDFSPFQLHSSGVFQGETFEIIGRLQIQYDEGSWNEWYVIFSNGENGWLGDFSGQYAITRSVSKFEKPTPFADLIAGVSRINYNQKQFIASDIREAKSCKANAQGELPFVFKNDETVLTADFRYLNEFITLDYSDENPVMYAGKMVALNDLRCQNLRSNDLISASSGKLRGQKTAFGCPSCGASLNWYPGIARNVVCPSCHSDIALDENKAKVIATHQMRKIKEGVMTLELGEVAKIGGVSWTIIGFVKKVELPGAETLHYISGANVKIPNTSDSWYEYLLYNLQKGFMWLVESDGSWDLSRPLDTWPEMNASMIPTYKNKPTPKLYDYGGRVEYVAGAFYWHIGLGDVTYCQDYRYNQGKLCAERTKEELSWSLSRPITGLELSVWFNRPELDRTVTLQDENEHMAFAKAISIIFILINIPALFLSFLDDNIELIAGICLIVIWIIWRPFSKNEDDDEDDDDD